MQNGQNKLHLKKYIVYVYWLNKLMQYLPEGQNNLGYKLWKNSVRFVGVTIPVNWAK